MEFDIEKYAKLITNSGKKKQRKEYNSQIRKALEDTERRKITSTWEYWQRTPSKKAEMKEKKSTLKEW